MKSRIVSLLLRLQKPIPVADVQSRERSTTRNHEAQWVAGNLLKQEVTIANLEMIDQTSESSHPDLNYPTQICPASSLRVLFTGR
jgi:hypothetical protein